MKCHPMVSGKNEKKYLLCAHFLLQSAKSLDTH